MKKTFLILAALFMLSSMSFAGGDFDFAIGPKIGYQTTKLSYYKADIKSGFSNHFTVGVFGRVTIGRLYIQPELLYFKTSNVFDLTVTGTDNNNLFNLPTGANVNMTLNSMNLQMPILLGMNLLDTKLVTLRAQIGPTANFVLKSQTLYDETYTYNGQQFVMEQGDVHSQEFDTKSISWGFQAGLGVDVLKRFTLDINYNFGMSNVFNSLNDTSLGNTFDFSNIDRTKENIFMVTLGIKFF